MTKTQFIKWLLDCKGSIARDIVRMENYDNVLRMTDTPKYKSLLDQNSLLAMVINAAQDIDNLE
jgi:hypothetical protein